MFNYVPQIGFSGIGAGIESKFKNIRDLEKAIEKYKWLILEAQNS